MCNNLKCKFCGSNIINKRGKQKYNGKQRYLCRDCGKIWTDGKDNRLKYSNKKREKVIKMYLENVSIRSIERLEGVSEPLILKWIKKMGKEIKNKFNESINKIKDNINNIDEKDIKKENIEILEIDEARSGSKSSLLEFASLSSHEVRNERSESQAWTFLSANFGINDIMQAYILDTLVFQHLALFDTALRLCKLRA